MNNFLRNNGEPTFIFLLRIKMKAIWRCIGLTDAPMLSTHIAMTSLVSGCWLLVARLQLRWRAIMLLYGHESILTTIHYLSPGSLHFLFSSFSLKYPCVNQVQKSVECRYCT